MKHRLPIILPTLHQRHELLAYWRGPGRAHLAKCLRRHDAADFDRQLLDYITHRNGPRFYFRSQDVPSRLQQARRAAPDDVARWLRNARHVLGHRFPPSDDSHQLRRVQLPRHFSWHNDPTGDMEFVHTLNRHRSWVELAVAYRLTGRAKYADEVKNQLISWVEQNPPVDNPTAALKVYPRWHLLDAAIRGDTWPWTFYLLLGTPAWTPAVNTLFLHQLREHGRYLDHLSPRGLGGNWTIMQAQGLLNIALLFPEFKESSDWEHRAKLSLIACFNRQFLADGGHIEQSPSYHLGSVCTMVEPLYLAALNGRAWAKRLMPRLRQAGECFFLMLQPDGSIPLLSDSDRKGVNWLAGPSLLLNEPKWLRFAKPGLREILLSGKQPRPRPSRRPMAVAFRDCGYYVMRSGDKPRDLQIIFDCGLKGGSHGHFDLLSFELCGFGKPLICDPGRLHYIPNNPNRQWIVSTPAHNTISIDGLNHAGFENVHDRRFKVTEWTVRPDHVQISAQHRGYAKLAGRPVVGRTLRYDRKHTLVLHDWGRGSAEHEYTISFTLPGRDAIKLPDGSIYTTHAQGNVLIQPQLLPGQKTACEKIFWSPNYGQKEPAVRFTIRQKTRQPRFTTMIVAYPARRPPVLE